MQVVCDKCGARYEFEAADIPAEGYDAQCTSCGHIFFVSPEGDAPSRAMEMPTPAPEALAPEEPLAETMAEMDSPLVGEADELPPTELDVIQPLRTISLILTIQLTLKMKQMKLMKSRKPRLVKPLLPLIHLTI